MQSRRKIEKRLSDITLQREELSIEKESIQEQLQALDYSQDVADEELISTVINNSKKSQEFKSRLSEIRTVDNALMARQRELEQSLHEIDGEKVVRAAIRARKEIYKLAEKNNALTKQLNETRRQIADKLFQVNVDDEYSDTQAYSELKTYLVPTLPGGHAFAVKDLEAVRSELLIPLSDEMVRAGE